MEPEALIHREEVTSALFAISGLNENVDRIRKLLEQEFGDGEEEVEEDFS